jgi:hypothetical protein
MDFDALPTTPKRQREPENQEPDTLRRVRFFYAFDHNPTARSLPEICEDPEIDVTPRTGRYWLQQREERGDSAYRRTRRQAKNLGRLSRVRTRTLDRILEDDELNETRFNTLVPKLDLSVAPRTLQGNFSKRKGAYRFKKPRTEGISNVNK